MTRKSLPLFSRLSKKLVVSLYLGHCLGWHQFKPRDCHEAKKARRCRGEEKPLDHIHGEPPPLLNRFQACAFISAAAVSNDTLEREILREMEKSQAKWSQRHTW
jgi:hypothetical protein